MPARSSFAPLAEFFEERARARAASDPMANLCTAAAVVADPANQQTPDLRTLVLRDIEGALGLFINATSPKWSAFAAGPVNLVTYWPSIQVQYRMHVNTRPIPPAIIHASWHLRPDSPKRMDWYYEHVAPQSSPVEDRATLLRNVESLELDEPLQAPPSARGLMLEPVSVERLDLSMDNGIHDRTRACRTDEGWIITTLVP